MESQTLDPARRETRRLHRGQAMVEMVVSLVVVIPLFLYVLFLQDYTLHYLDWQESVVTPAWDAYSFDYVNAETDYKIVNPPAWIAPIAGGNHRKSYLPAVKPMFAGTPEAKVQSVARLNFCDHTSARNSSGAFSPANHLASAAYDPIAARGSPDCGGKALTSIGGHPSWTVGGARQVRCSQEPHRASEIVRNFAGRPEAAQSADRRGGVIWCTSSLSVVNMLLPKRKLFDWGGEVNITEKDRHRSGDPDGAAASTAWTFGGPRSQDTFGMLHDAWSLNHVMNIDTRYVADAAGPFAASSFQYGEGNPGINGGSYVDINNPRDNYKRNPFWKRVDFFYSGPGATPSLTNAIREARRLGRDLRRVYPYRGFWAGFLSDAATQDGPVGDDPGTPTLAYRRDDRYTSGSTSRNPSSRYGHQKQDFSAVLDDGAFGQYAAGWDDPNQQAAWTRRNEQYFGRPWRAWVDP